MNLKTDISAAMATTGHGNVSFPLTPALSPGERANSASLVGVTRASVGHSMLNPAFLFHEPAHPLTPSLSPTGGEGVRRTGEGDLRRFMVPMRAKNGLEAPHEPHLLPQFGHPLPLEGGEGWGEGAARRCRFGGAMRAQSSEDALPAGEGQGEGNRDSRNLDGAGSNQAN